MPRNSILVASLAGLLTGVVTYLIFGQLVTSIIPALLVSTVVFVVVQQRVGKRVQAELEAIPALLEQRQIDQAIALIDRVQAQYGPWQAMLHGQLEAQKGMLDYAQMKFDVALPKLEQGTFQNWTAQVCIGLVHARKNDLEKAQEWLKKAESSGEKELMVYLTQATILARNGLHSEALQCVSRGLEKLPENPHLNRIQKALRNKQKIKTTNFPDSWYTFFPEDMKRLMMTRGMRNGGGQMEQMRQKVMQQSRKGKGRKMRPR